MLNSDAFWAIRIRRKFSHQNQSCDDVESITVVQRIKHSVVAHVLNSSNLVFNFFLMLSSWSGSIPRSVSNWTKGIPIATARHFLCDHNCIILAQWNSGRCYG